MQYFRMKLWFTWQHKNIYSLAQFQYYKDVLLIKSEKFDRFIKDLTDNWLDLRNIDFTSPDRSLNPEFDD